jgi:uncharacterized membrane protein HdeD (DUF308 family)
MDMGHGSFEDPAMEAKTPAHQLAGTLWLVSLLRGVAALALGGYVLAVPPTSPGGLARAVAVYWVVEGLIVLGGSLSTPGLSLSRMRLLLRSVAVVMALAMVALPLQRVFGPWEPGQIMLLLLVLPLVLVAIGFQILAAIFDIVVSVAVRRHIAGEWSLGLAAAISIVFGVALVVAIFAPPAVLGRGVGVVGIAGGLAVIAGAVRLRPSAAPSLPAMPR